MKAPQAEGWTRRRVLGGLTLAGTAGFLGLRARPSAAEPSHRRAPDRTWRPPGDPYRATAPGDGAPAGRLRVASGGGS
jgi:hypothetical protein